MSNFPELEPVQKYQEIDYLKGIKELLPNGFLWEFPLRLLSEVLQDIIVGGADDLQDIIDTGSGEIQDIVFGQGEFSSVLGAFFSCFAVEMFRLDQRVTDLLREAIPGLSVELLEQWEFQAGLPSVCNPEPGTLVERQLLVHEKIINGSQTTTTQYYIDLAASLGFTVNIVTDNEYNASSVCGIGRCGVDRYGTGPLYYSGVMVVEVTAGTGDLATLQCVFSQVQAAHFIIIWEDLR